MPSMQLGADGAEPSRAWPADRVERWPLERLRPDANNPRLHSEADLDKIAAAIRKWGWTMPVLADEEGGLICGHARVGAAAKLGLKSVPVIIARGWNEAKKRAYRLADNQLAARASWDPEQLGNELRELQITGFDLDLIGFEPNQLETILAGMGSSGLTNPDSVPEVPDQPITRLGDVWLLARASGGLRRQHERNRCCAGAGGIRASPDGRRSALWGQLRALLASAPRPGGRQARAGHGTQ
jgi:ParB-like chromosome segregation protein Spo0J